MTRGACFSPTPPIPPTGLRVSGEGDDGGTVQGVCQRPRGVPGKVLNVACARRECRWYRTGVVRLLPLWQRRCASVQRAVLPDVLAIDRNTAGLRYLRDRVCRPAAWRGHLRPF